GLKRLCIRRRNVFRAPHILEHGVLRPNRRIVKPGRDRVRSSNLPRSILQHIRVSSLQNARRATAKTGRMIAERFAAPPGLDSDEFNFLVFEEVVEDADGVRSSANASDDGSGKLAFSLKNLRAGFASD